MRRNFSSFLRIIYCVRGVSCTAFSTNKKTFHQPIHTIGMWQEEKGQRDKQIKKGRKDRMGDWIISTFATCIFHNPPLNSLCHLTDLSPSPKNYWPFTHERKTLSRINRTSAPLNIMLYGTSCDNPSCFVQPRLEA